MAEECMILQVIKHHCKTKELDIQGSFMEPARCNLKTWTFFFLLKETRGYLSNQTEDFFTENVVHFQAASATQAS